MLHKFSERRCRASRVFRRAGTVAIAGSLLLLPFAKSAHAELIYGISTTSLFSFDSTTPQTMTTIGPFTGLVAGQTLRAIDFRPSNGLLYAMSYNNGTAAQLYRVNLTNAALTAVGGSLALNSNGSIRLSIDFDPRADILRVITGNGRNFRINANNGTVIAQDTTVNENGTNIDGVIGDIAYSSNVAGASSTTLYAYDYSNDIVGRIGSPGGTPNSPDGGQFSSVGSSGVQAAFADMGFDISGATGIAYLTLDENSSPTLDTEFYRVNLANGQAQLVGTNSAVLADISVYIAPVATPEPSSFILFGTGVATVGGIAFRRGKSKNT